MDTTDTIENRPSIWLLLINILDRPRQTFTHLVNSASWAWVLPLVLFSLTVIISVWVTAPYTSQNAEQEARQRLNQSNMSPAEVERAMAEMARFTSPTFIAITGSVAGTLVSTFIWVATAALLFFLSLVGGAEFYYNTVFTIVAWSYLPIALRNGVQTAYIAITGSFPVYPGLAALQVTGNQVEDASNPLITLLSFVDIFWMWHIMLLVIGLAVATKFSYTKSFFIVLVYNLLAIGIPVGVTIAFGMYQ